MPTGRESDVIPLRKATKRRLDGVRGDQTYDAAVRRLLDTHFGPALAEAEPPPREAPASAARHPDEQLLIARLAEARWRLWESRGRIRWLGPRLVEYWPSQAKAEVTYVVPRRRGFTP